ncbi:MAG TPA: hypothetical protein VGD52_04095 [Pseudoduganella sp.]
MSQNSHTLTLFFSNRVQHLHCDLLLKALSNGNRDEARRWSDKLGVNLDQEWDGDWFNIECSAEASHIQLNYDTSNRYHLPLETLSRLFKVGLKAAVLHVFFDQVGEHKRYHFLGDALVGRKYWQQKLPEFAQLLAVREDADVTIEDVGNSSPQPLTLLIDEHQRQEEEAKQAVRAFIGDAGKDGPGALVKSWRLLRAIGRGLAHAAIFTIAALIVFKGSKLMWLGIGGVLALVLPIAYAWWESRKWSNRWEVPGFGAIPQRDGPYVPTVFARVGPPLPEAENAAIRQSCQRALAGGQADIRQYLDAFQHICPSLAKLDKKYNGDESQVTDDNVSEFRDLYAQQEDFLRSEKMHGYFCQYYRNLLQQIQAENLLGTMILQFSEAYALSSVLIGMLDNKEAAAAYSKAVNSMDDFLTWKDYLLMMTEEVEEQ